MLQNALPIIKSFLTLSTLLILASCQRFQNSVDKVELYCGTLNANPDRQIYIRLVTEDGPLTDSLPWSSVKGRLVDLDHDHRTLNISISEKSCATLPRDRLKNTRLEVRVENSTLAAVKVFNETFPDDLEIIKLQPARTGKYSLACPQDGIFASQTFINPLVISDTESIETNQIKLIAQPVSLEAATVVLARKDFGYGLDNSTFTTEISTQNLQEGVYYLRAMAASVSEDFGLLPKFINEEKACVLTVMRTLPEIGSQLFSKSGFFISQKNQPLPIPLKPEVSSIKFCRQPYRPRNGAIQSCQQILSECANVNSFITLSDEATDVTGLFDYFFHAYDRAGNKSHMQCQSLAVVDKPVSFSVSWPFESWEQPSAYMTDATVRIKPIIAIADKQTLPAEHIEQSLQCRVEFISHEGITIQGNDATCLEGRCRGKSLHEFVPCDRTFSMSLARAWNHSYINNSTLKLIIQANIGAELTTKLTKSINIQGNRWKVEKLSAPDAGWDSFVKIGNQSLLASFRQSGTYKWQNETWTQILPTGLAPNSLVHSKILKDSQGAVFGFFEQKADNTKTPKLEIHEYVDEAWQPLNEQPVFSDCKLVTARPGSGFTCLGSNSDLLTYDGQTWSTELAGRTTIRESRFRSMVYVDNTLYVATEKSVYSRHFDHPEWQKVLSFPENEITNVMQVQSFDGALWIYASDRQKAKILRIPQLEPAVVEEIPAPPIKTNSLNSIRAFGITESEALTFFSYQWNSSQKIWQRIEVMPSDTPGYDPKLEKDLDGRLWMKSSVGFMAADDSQFWPMAHAGVEPSEALMTNAKGELYFLGIPAEAETVNIYRLRRNSYFVLNYASSRLPAETFPDAWVNAEGNINTVSFRNGEVLALHDSSWQVKDTFPNATMSGFYEKSLPLKDGSLAIKTAAGLIIKRPGTAWKSIFKVGDKLQTLIPNAGAQELITTDTLQGMNFIGEMPDATIILGLNQDPAKTPLSHLVAIQPNGEVISKTSLALTRLSLVQNAVLVKQGILLTGKSLPAGQPQRTLFVLLDSKLEVLRRSTLETSNLYLSRMKELAPEFTQETFLAGFALTESGRGAVCSFRSTGNGVARSGRFLCLELILGSELGLGNVIATPSEEQIEAAMTEYSNHDPVPYVRIVEGKRGSVLIFNGEIFETPALMQSSAWSVKVPRHQLYLSLGTHALVQDVYHDVHDRFIIGFRNAGILVLD